MLTAAEILQLHHTGMSHCTLLQGPSYFQTETSRLERLLEGGKVGGAKLQEIAQKLSVLSAFSKDDDAAAEE